MNFLDNPRQIIITGTGRCGTGFVAQVLSQLDIGCSHESIFQWPAPSLAFALGQYELRENNPAWGWWGESSWLAAPFLEDDDIRQGKIIVHLVRDPARVIQSHLAIQNWTENNGNWQTGIAFMHEQMPELHAYDDPAHKSGLWYLEWNRRIEPYRDILHRVEDDVTLLLDQLGIDYAGREIFDDAQYNHFQRQAPVPFHLSSLLEPLRVPLLEMAGQYGY